MLALNASIEAARAGEEGAGFAVVAQEVKELAEEASDATGEIERRIAEVQATTDGTVEGIEEMRGRVDAGADTIEDAIEMFDEIAEAVEDAESGITEINAAMDDQAATTEEVVAMADEVATVSQETAAEAGNVSAATEEQAASLSAAAENVRHLSTLAERLHENVEGFDVPHEHDGKPSEVTTDEQDAITDAESGLPPAESDGGSVTKVDGDSSHSERN
jgi:methyl-accepting chemotaxis protein